MFLVDFGRVAFGNLSLSPDPSAADATVAAPGEVTVRFGEALKNGRVDTQPPGSVRYAEVKVRLNNSGSTRVAPPADPRNTKPPAVLTPPGWGVLLPFRWIEVEGWPGELHMDEIRRLAAFDSTWNDDAAFSSSDQTLNRIWDLCHYSIKATTFAGIFVDGDRERLAYEADAYLTQLSYYAGDADPRMARATFDRLMEFPTWPTEWAPHMVFIAHADWMQTGDTAWLAAHYEGLKTKLLDERVGPDGLVTSTPEQINHGDIVDWPPQERDGYVFTSVNTVVNAFHLRALKEMSKLAEALGKKEEAAKFAERERSAQATFQEKLFDPARGLYRDGIGTDHASEHANLFPLAFGLVPPQNRSRIAQWLAGRGMAVSVYAAQYLLDGLFENGEDAAALALIGAEGDRSWRHMIESGTTITWEAWDQKYKAESGLEPRVGCGSGEPSTTLRARRASADARLGPSIDPASSRSAGQRRRQDTHSTRRYLGRLETGKKLYHDSRSAVRRDGKGRATRVPGLARSLERRRECTGVSRGAVVEIATRYLGNNHYRGEMTEVAGGTRRASLLLRHISISPARSMESNSEVPKHAAEGDCVSALIGRAGPGLGPVSRTAADLGGGLSRTDVHQTLKEDTTRPINMTPRFQQTKFDWDVLSQPASNEPFLNTRT